MKCSSAVGAKISQYSNSVPGIIDKFVVLPKLLVVVLCSGEHGFDPRAWHRFFLFVCCLEPY